MNQGMVQHGNAIYILIWIKQWPPIKQVDNKVFRLFKCSNNNDVKLNIVQLPQALHSATLFEELEVWQ